MRYTAFVFQSLCAFRIKPGACVNQNTSKYADDFSAAARERDRTQPSTIERLSYQLHQEFRAAHKLLVAPIV